MLMISPDEICRLAALAHLELTAAEIEKFSKELSEIIDFFEKLQAVDTENVEPTAQVTGLENVTRSDEVKDCDTAAALLQSSPNEIRDDHIVVKSVL